MNPNEERWDVWFPNDLEVPDTEVVGDAEEEDEEED